MKNLFLFNLVAVSLLMLTCTPKGTDKPTQPPTSAKDTAGAGGAADPFTGLMVSDAHLPWVFKHGAGPKPPASGFEKLLAFPQPPAPPKVQAPGPLKVLRVQPTGEIHNTAALTVAFSQPMVPLASLDQMRDQPIPVTLEPAVQGRWRWLGTTLLAFEPQMRFPFSTHYYVKIPQGTKSALGSALPEAAQFSFSTPALNISSGHPYSGETHARPETVIVLHFDQKVDAEKLAPFLSMQKSGGAAVPWKMLSKKEFTENEYVKKQALTWNEGRSIAFLPVKPLDKAAAYTITLKKGAPSAEGPRKTAQDQFHSFTTYGPLKVVKLRCGWNNEPCRPGYSWNIEFSNPVATEEEPLQKFFKIAPKVAEQKVELHGMYGNIQGEFKPATSYKITINAGIEDAFGQKMAAPFSTTINVGDEYPYLNMPAYHQAVLEAATSRTLPVPSVNIVNTSTVKLVKIAPEDIFPALAAAARYYDGEEKASPSTGLNGPVTTWQMKFNKKKNQREITHIELDRALKKKNGIVFVEINAPDLRISRWDTTYRQLVVQVTSIGITARYDADRIHILTTGLTDGRPRGNVPLKIFAQTSASPKGELVWEGRSAADGTVMAPGPEARKKFGQYLVVAGDEADLAFVVLDGSGSDGGYTSSYSSYYTPAPEARLRYQIFTDRDPYRPGETVELTGWMRRETRGPEGRLGFLQYDKAELEWEVSNPQGESVEKGKSPIDRHGAFSVRFKSSADAMLGRYSFAATIKGIAGFEKDRVYHGFSILAYRTPEHVVTVTIPPKTYMFGDMIPGSIEGRYTFGAAMKKADVSWSANLQETSFRPPKHPEFTFGMPMRYHWGCWGRRCPSTNPSIASGSGQLDDLGFLNIQIDAKKPADADRALKPGLITLEADVTDVNRQSISSRTTTLVHPSAVYTGLRTAKNLIKEGEPIQIEGVVVDTEGARKAGKTVKVRALLRSWKRKSAKKLESGEDPYETVDEEKGACTFTSAADPASCSMTIAKAGYYVLEGSATDEKGRAAVTQRFLYVAGKDAVAWKQDNQEKIELVLDREGPYKPGERAKILVQAPFYPVVGMLTVEREGIVSHKQIQVTSSTHVEEIAIEEKHLPNLNVSVALVRGRVKVAQDSDDDPGRPLMATGRVRIPISLDSKKITLAVKPSKNLIKPGETVTLDLRATDVAGAPVQARLAVMLVDEGVLSLLGFATPNPLAVFYPERYPNTALDDLRIHLLKKTKMTPPADSRNKSVQQKPMVMNGNGGGGRYRNGGAKMADAAPAPPMTAAKRSSAEAEEMSGTPGGGDGFVGITMRTFFATTAYFNNQVQTGADGSVSLKIPMPENLTSFRVMVVAMDTATPDRFGSADDKITVRKDFMVRPALPRFANYQDAFEAAVVLNTLLDREGKAEVKISGTGFELVGPDVLSVQLSSKKAEELRFKVKTPNPGEARFTFAARFLDQTDGVNAPAIPVHVPVTTENTAVYGMTDAAVLQPITPPAKVLPQFGGLDLHLSSTGLSGLQDAVKFLIENHYDCSEAIASRLVPIFALKDIIPQFKLGTAADEKLLHDLAVKGIAELLSYQHWNGGFKLWSGSYLTWSFVSAYVTWALIRAREAGFRVPDRNLIDAAEFLQGVLQANRMEYEWYYSYTTQIYAGWVLTELQRLKLFTPQQMDRWRLKSNLHRLYNQRDKVGFLARTWLLHALWRIEGKSDKVLELLRTLENGAVETAAGAHFAEVTTEGLALLMHSQARTDAVVLRVLLDIDPQHVLLSKIVRGLMASRIRGEWETSQGNAFVLDALAAYFRVIEAQTPDFHMNAWYDKLFAGTKHFKGRSMDIVHARISMKTLLDQGAGRLILTKDGPGKLYYRIGLAYVPASLNLPPESQGIFVKRSYESMEDDDKAVLQVAPGKWRVKAGETVRVKLTIIVQDRRHFVAMEDPFPAGFEGVDMQLNTSSRRPTKKGTGSSVESPSYSWWWHQPTHHEMRDDRFVAYYDQLHAGVYEYVYLARATTIGTFTAPPTRALEMYQPEVFGRGAGETVEVVP